MTINSLFVLILILIINVLFKMDYHIPISVSILIFIYVFCSLILYIKNRKSGFLMLLIYLIYAIPFIHIIPYLWLDLQSEKPEKLWGLISNDYNTNIEVVNLMGSIGAMGALGFLFGIELNRRSNKIFNNKYDLRRMPIFIFYIWVILGIVFSYIFAPSSTITDGRMTGISLSAEWGFGSSWFFSYVFILFALADALFELKPSRRIHKLFIIILATLYIVIWLQLLRGDRECFPALVAGILMFIYIKTLNEKNYYINKNHIIFLLISLLLILFLSSFLVIFRSEVTGLNFEETFSQILQTGYSYQFQNLFYGTWSAVLLTPLSVSGDYINQLLPIEYGQTYLDLIASIIPGFLADLIGYVRPIDATRGPAYMMTFGQGGTHAVVVPFMNFRMVGVFAIIAIWSYLLSKVETYCLSNPNVVTLALIGSLITIAPHWLWYGEKLAMSGLLVWLLIFFLYKSSIFFAWKK